MEEHPSCIVRIWAVCTLLSPKKEAVTASQLLLSRSDMYGVASDMQKIKDGFRCSKFGVPTWSALFYRLNALPRVLGVGGPPFLTYPLRASPFASLSLTCCIPLVALADEVVLQRLDGLCGVSCLLGLAVVCDQDGLLRRGDGDAGSSLDVVVAQVSALLASFPACGNAEGRQVPTWRA